MKEDIKNVVITFGLIVTALFSGSFVYQKKAESEYLLAIKQEQLQSLIDEQQALVTQLSRQAEIQKAAVTESAPTQKPTPAQPIKPKPTPAVTPKAVAVTPPPQPVAQPSPVVKTLAPIPAPAKTPVVVKPTRKSRAS